jgi:hypothetical protein
MAAWSFRGLELVLPEMIHLHVLEEGQFAFA